MDQIWSDTVLGQDDLWARMRRPVVVTDLKRFLVKDWRGYNIGTVHATHKQLTVYIVRIVIYLLNENRFRDIQDTDM